MATPATFVDAFDGFIVDADGVLYRGSAPVPYAIDAMTEVAQSRPWCVVTNNAANAPGVVAEKLRGLGLAADDGNVVTSPQGAAVFLARHHIAASAHVFVVGGAGIDHALLEAGFVPVREPDPSAVAVVQGLGMEVCWNDLANAGYAIQSGALWVATNPDTSLPTEQGLAPGNGALVAALSATLGRQPDAVTGKPEPLLFEVAAQRLAAGTPLVIGDRVDTDIRGANRAGMESLLVLTGVVQARDLATLASVDPEFRPTYLAADLRALADTVDGARIADTEASGGGALGEVRRLLARSWAGIEPLSESDPALVNACSALAEDLRHP